MAGLHNGTTLYISFCYSFMTGISGISIREAFKMPAFNFGYYLLYSMM
jgi:hypothetical protein